MIQVIDDEPFPSLVNSIEDELRELSAGTVRRLYVEAPQAKGGIALLANWILVQLTSNTLDILVGVVHRWAGRADRRIQLSIGGDTLVLTGATAEQQDLALEAFLARHCDD